MPNIAANVSYEIESWQTADTLSGRVNAVKYKRFALDMISHNFISDAFEEHTSASRRGELNDA